jgi:hypothetical protein
MCCGVLKAAGGLGAIVALILVVVALLKQIVLLLGFLLAALKIAIIVVFGYSSRPFAQKAGRDVRVSRKGANFPYILFSLRLPYISSTKLQQFKGL